MKTKGEKRPGKTSQGIEVPVADVYSLSGKKVDKFKLNPEIFNARINRPLLHQVVVAYNANLRQGTASTRTRGQVRGGGRKPWRQKGTGRARAGSIRSPLWRGGGVVFGPRPRDFNQALPKKMKRLAILSSLSAKAKDGELLVIEKDIELSQPKTKEIARLLAGLKIYKRRVLYLYSKRDENLLRSCGNIKDLTIKMSGDFNALDVLLNSRVIFSRDTHEAIVKRLADKE